MADPQRWIDEWDQEAHHHAIFRGDVLAGATRFTLHDDIDAMQDRVIFGDVLDALPLPIAHATRMVVDPRFRGQGIGGMLDWVIANAAFLAGAQAIVVTTGSSSETEFRHGQMLKHGWQCVGTAAGKTSLPILGDQLPSIYIRVKGD